MGSIVPVRMPLDGGLNNWPDPTVLRPNQAAIMRDCWVRRGRLERKPGRTLSGEAVAGDPILRIREVDLPDGTRELITVREDPSGLYYASVDETSYVYPLIVACGQRPSTGLGLISRSVDGGLVWTNEVSTGTQKFWRMIRLSSGVLLAVTRGNNVYVYRSTDNGDTWSSWDSSMTYGDGSPDIVQLANGNVLLFADSGGNPSVKISTDNGGTWGGAVTVGTGDSGRLLQLASGVVLATCPDGSRMRRSTDNGATWASPTTNVGNYTLVPMAQTDDGKVYVLGQGIAYVSSDSGANWAVTSGAFPSLFLDSTQVEYGELVCPTGNILLAAGQKTATVATLYRCTDPTGGTVTFEERASWTCDPQHVPFSIRQREHHYGNILVPYSAGGTTDQARLWLSKDNGATWSILRDVLTILGFSGDERVAGVAFLE